MSDRKLGRKTLLLKWSRREAYQRLEKRAVVSQQFVLLRYVVSLTLSLPNSSRINAMPGSTGFLDASMVLW